MKNKRAMLLTAAFPAVGLVTLVALTSAQASLNQPAAVTAQPITVQSIPALPPSAAAQTAQAAPAAPDTFQASPLAEHPGWRIASACFACHGTDGKDDTFGALNVFTKEDFVARMQELKTTEAENEGLMKPHSAGYTDAQIEQMADYFSQIE